MRKASFLSRLWAWLVDGIIIAILGSAFSAAVTFLLNASARGESGFLSFLAAWVALFIVLFLLLLQFLYFGLFWSGSGQTVGMRFFKIRVLMQDAGSPSFLRAGLRGTVGYYISGLFFFLGYIWALFDKEGEAWHDKIFDTMVVSLV